MKKLLLLLIFVTQAFWAQNAFEQGNKFYGKENYEAAITSYESVVNSGNQSAELYFNLGNCYYKLHKVAPAIYNYEKALLLSPNDTEIKNNLEFARKMAVDDIKVIPRVGFSKLIQDFTAKYYYDTWAWIAVAFAFLFLLFCGVLLFAFNRLQTRFLFWNVFLAIGNWPKYRFRFL